LVGPGQDLDGFGQLAVAGDGPALVPIGAHDVRQDDHMAGI
jgi:hypothetical protein